MPQKVIIIGCGVIGAAIAYELSFTDLQITVLETKPEPAQGATAAALGVLMAACSHTKNVDLTALRLFSLKRYESLIPELIQQTELDIPYNRDGILCLSNHDDIEDIWRSLIITRAQQGFNLNYLDRARLQQGYSQLKAQHGLYSPSDRSLNPTKLVQALVRAAELRGVEFKYNCTIQFDDFPRTNWIVITAGMGSEAMLKQLNLLNPNVTLLEPVGGQAIRVRAPQVDFPMVVHAVNAKGEDINIVPLGDREYWIGATLEFQLEELPRSANVPLLLNQAIEFCDGFSNAEIVETWAGYRPRPLNKLSPILGFVPNQPHILVATGHYRNGVLMAPVTACISKDLITKGSSDLPWRKFALS